MTLALFLLACAVPTPSLDAHVSEGDASSTGSTSSDLGSGTSATSGTDGSTRTDGTTPGTTGGSTTEPTDPTDPTDSTDPTGTTDTGTTGATTYVPDDPSTLGAGWAWVRTERPFVSGLAVNLGPPSVADVARYYDDFHATATHLWETGLPDEIAGWDAAAHPDFRWVSWTDRNGVHPVTGVGVGDVPVATGRIGYQIWDEPRSPDDVDSMVPGVNRVRTEDPDALVIVNFGNSFTVPEEELYTYAIDTLGCDVVAYDYYSDGHGEYERAKLVRDVAQSRGLPYWRYIDSFGDHHRSELPADDLRWAAMLGLVYGYSGHTWFLYQTDANTAEVVYTTLFDGTGRFGHVPNERFWEAASLNQELEGYAESVNMLTSTAVTYEPMSVLYMPDDHRPFAPGDGGDAYLVSVENVGLGALETQEWSLGVFEDDHGETYLMVQNANHVNASFPLYRPRGTVRLTFDFAGAPAALDPTVLERWEPLSQSVESWSLTWDGGTQAHLDLELDAGDVALLKYSTGAPFARRP